ncbi:MAG: iron-containing redox enzyme family protein [Nannocystaceae bacterium]|nr:iron-containing redox enzyme family protein [Nannocystaceae bacterium]
MHLTTRPQIAPFLHTTLTSNEFVASNGVVDVTYEGDGATLVAELMESLDGSHTLGQLGEHHGIGIEQLKGLLAPLRDESFLLDAAIDAYDTMSGREFMTSFRHECRFWSQHIFSRPFWTSLRAGEASLPVVLGWGVEFHHYVRHADRYMAAGVAYCSESWRARQWLSDHFVEEVGHSEIFLRGLAECDLSRSRVLGAMPLPATQALMHALMESAYEGAVPYAACFGLTQPESVAPTPDAQRTFYDGLSAHYVPASPLFEAFLQHSLLDAELGHERLVIERMLSEAESVDRSQRVAAIRAVRRLAECFVVFFDQVRDYYTDQTRPFPRRSPSLADLNAS